MNVALDALMEGFFRTYTDPFTAKEFSLFINRLGLKISEEESAEYLNAEPRVFSLERQLYITRAGAFTNKFFSFKPLRQEVEQNVFVAADRCIPFVDSEVVSCHLVFLYRGKPLPKKIFETSSIVGRDLFNFFGDEYVSQYVASDPANDSLKIPERGYELPTKIFITGYDLSPILKDVDFKYGDRLLCRVVDWNNCVLEVFPEVIHELNPFLSGEGELDRRKWIENLESYLIESFDRMGPCGSIEEQLANVFYEHGRALCCRHCSSIHEFLDASKKVGMEPFGVETRLWFKGQNVPAVGKWNAFECDGAKPTGFINFEMPDYLVDCFLKDQLFEKKDDIDAVIDKMIPPALEVTPEDRRAFTLQITRRDAIIRRKYNWFADFAIGSIRHRALELYMKVGALVYDIDSTGNKLDKYPQQELVILSQLFAHIMKMLEVLADSKECPEEEVSAMTLSLEGMEFNFEDIRLQLISTVNKLHAEDFEVI